MLGSPYIRNRDEILERLNAIVSALDRGLDRSNGWFALFFFCGPLALFFGLWAAVDLPWWLALAAAVADLIVTPPIGIGWDNLLVRGAVRAFDREFPADGPERPVALTLLAEAQFPHGAHQKMAEKLLPDGMRVRDGSIDGDIGRQLLQVEGRGVEERPAPHPVQPSPPPQQPRPKPKVYDYIPLEPMATSDGGEGRKGKDRRT